MKLVILYRPNSEHATPVETFVHDYQRRHGTAHMELVNIDEREGVALVSLYDVTDYPAMLVLSTDGSLQHLWQGPQLPLMDEVASYMFEA